MPTQIDSGITQAVRYANKISITKNIFGENRIETTVTPEKTSFNRNTVDVWPKYGYLTSSLATMAWSKRACQRTALFTSIKAINLIRTIRKFIIPTIS